MDGYRMIIVAGHAICLRPERAMSDESWVLLPYQEGEAGKYVEHIRAGVAEAKGWFGHAGVRERTITEEFSRDSYENLLYSICRGKEYRGSYPDFVTFVSWEFKRERFDLHRRGIGWPLERFSYLGVNNPEALEQASRAEAATRAGYERDPYSGSAEFRAKKEARNPFRRRHGYSESCQELRELMEYGGPDWFVGRLPWG
jgi:hypothetical protein